MLQVHLVERHDIGLAEYYKKYIHQNPITIRKDEEGQVNELEDVISQNVDLENSGRLAVAEGPGNCGGKLWGRRQVESAQSTGKDAIWKFFKQVLNLSNDYVYRAQNSPLFF